MAAPAKRILAAYVKAKMPGRKPRRKVKKDDD